MKVEFEIDTSLGGAWRIKVKGRERDLRCLIRKKAIDELHFITKSGVRFFKKAFKRDENLKRQFVMDLIRTLPKKDFFTAIDLAGTCREFGIDLSDYLKSLIAKGDVAWFDEIKEEGRRDDFSRMYG